MKTATARARPRPWARRARGTHRPGRTPPPAGRGERRARACGRSGRRGPASRRGRATGSSARAASAIGSSANRSPSASSVWATRQVERPDGVRRSAVRCPPTPSARAEVAGERADVGAAASSAPTTSRSSDAARPCARRCTASSSCTVTGRAGSSTSSPARTRCVGALAVDLDRRDRRRAPARCRRRTPPAAARTSSSVERGRRRGGDAPRPRRRRWWCAAPSRIVASYALSVSVRWPSSRVARLTPSTSTPVAIGSSVPAWPTLRVPASRRTRATTSCEVNPAGLSTTTRPDALGVVTRRRLVVVEVVELVVLVRLAVRVGLAGVRRARRPRGHRGVGLAGLGEQVLDVPGGLRQRVEDELQRRRVPHAELLADLGADQALGRLERGRRADDLLLLAEHGVEDRGLLGVAGDPDVGDGDEAEPRVLDPPLQHLRDDDLDPVGDLADPGLAMLLLSCSGTGTPMPATRCGDTPQA